MQSTAYGFTCVRCAVCDVLWPSSSPPRSPFLRRRRRRRSFQLSFFSHIHRYGVSAHPLRLPPRLILRAPIYRSPFRLSSSAQRSRACAPRRAQPGPIGQFLRGRAGCLRLPGNRWRRPCRPFFLPLFSFFFSPASKSQWSCCCRFRCRAARPFGRWKLAAPVRCRERLGWEAGRAGCTARRPRPAHNDKAPPALPAFACTSWTGFSCHPPKFALDHTDRQPSI